VGATSFRSNFIAFFSSRGPITADGSGRMKPDLAAPGSDVRSSFLGGSYKSLHGTSMAAPHVAGAVALLWSAFPQLRRDVDQTEQILEQSALHQPSTACGSSGSPNNVYGYGTINVFDAYAEAERRYPPQLSVADASVVKPSAGSTELRFPVGLSRASTNDISVRYATLDGSAAAPVDYSATSGVITIPSGETEATVSVPVTGDTRCKAEDSLRLELSDPTDAGLGRSSAAGLIDTSKLCSDQGRESSGRGEATSR
jgi:subtilisin family serine protease